MERSFFAWIQKVFLRFRQEILYLIFGGLTTLVNFLVFFLLTAQLQGAYALEIATGTAWVLSVLFAYLTNRKWVFESKAKKGSAMLAEMLSFFGARVLSGLLDYGILLVTVRGLGWNPLWMKVLSNAVVIVANYFLSKLWVFREPASKRED